MKMLIGTILLIAGMLFAGCAGTVEKSSAVNANAPAANAPAAAKPAPPTTEALLAIEKKSWEDWAKRDSSGIEGFLASKFVGVGNSGASDRAAAVASWTGHKCEMKDLSFSDENVAELGDGAYLLTYKATQTTSCDGKPNPSPVYSSTVYVKEGNDWKAMYYQEVPAADAKGKYSAPSAPADKEKELASLAPAPDDLVAVEKKLWDTWKTQDRKGFEAHLADNMVVNGANGRLDRARYLTAAFESECKVDTISLGPMKSMEISKDLTMMFYRAAVKGTCGKDVIPANSIAATIYKRENGTPKAIYFMESPVQ